MYIDFTNGCVKYTNICPHTLERKKKAFANMTHQGEGYCIVVPFDCYIRLVLAF